MSARPLLERHSCGVTLTPAGQVLQRHAQRILADVDLLAADLSDHAAGVVGVVRLWANTSAVTQFLPDDPARFVAAHPGIRIELHEKDSSEAVLAVLDGRAELGIFAERTPTLGWARGRIGATGWCWWCRRHTRWPRGRASRSLRPSSARTPRAIVAQLNAEVAKAFDDPGVKEKLAQAGCEPFKSTPEQFAALIKDDLP